MNNQPQFWIGASGQLVTITLAASEGIYTKILRIPYSTMCKAELVRDILLSGLGMQTYLALIHTNEFKAIVYEVEARQQSKRDTF